MSVLRDLYQMQLVDSERDAKIQRLAVVEASLGPSEDVARAKQAASETQGSLDQLRAQLRDLELEIAGLHNKLKANQDRLYSGRVRNPKELSNLQEEAAALRRRESELEDYQLELMIAIEDDEAELAERQARLLQIETTWREEQARLQAEKEALEVDLTELEQDISGRRGRLGMADLAMYDDLRSGLGGVGVALLKRGICQVCGTDVPTGVARAVERGEGLHHCPTCNRLLSGG
jgi:predicted  nucleic acid-binding Zn-ribbon protein